MTADVQRELAEALTPLPLAYMSPQAVTAALLPTVQALIADAEKRAAARALRDAAEDLATVPGNPYPLVVSEFLNDRAAALLASAGAPWGHDEVPELHGRSEPVPDGPGAGAPAAGSADGAVPTMQGSRDRLIPYMMEDTPEEFERVRRLAWPAP